MKKNTPIVLCILAIAVVIAVAIVLIALTQQSPESDYELKISEAEKYMRSGDYDKAIIAYKAAISLDRCSEEAYLGLYRAYIRSGRTNLAEEALRQGLENTNSQAIRDKLQENFPELNLPLPDGEATENNSDNSKETDSSEDPDEDQTEPTSEDGAEYELSGHVFDAQSGAGVQGVYVIAYRAEDAYHKVTTTTSYDGAYRLALSQSGEYIVELSRPGYASDTVAVRISADMQKTTKDFTLTYTGEGTECALTGVVTDATTGNGVSGVELTIYPQDDQSDKRTITTDEAGKYSVIVYAGKTYVIDISKSGYISESVTLTVAEEQTSMEQNLTISPEMQSGEIRIVLTWGASPSDLDSHLMGTASDGTSVWCYYSNRSVRNSSGTEIVNLDVDDTTAYGPETTTIYDVNGVYEFCVRDYEQTGTMASSGATVKIYYGSSLMHTITVPADAVNVWNVCRISNGTIQIVNTAE